jgi:hypothetical protein
MSFMLAGLASGLGDGLQTLAEQRREEAQRLLEEQQEAARRGSGGGSGGGGSRSSRPRAVTAGMRGVIRSWAEGERVDDESVVSRFVTETERVLSENPDWSENRAWEHVVSHANISGALGRPDGTFNYSGQSDEPAQSGSSPGGGQPEPQDQPPGRLERLGQFLGRGLSADAWSGTPSDGSPQASSAAPAGFGAALGDAPASPNVSGVSAQRPPQPGDIIEGYRFMGGDPGDQNNWQRV